MAFRPLSANTAPPSRKVFVTEKTFSNNRLTPATSRAASTVPSRHAPAPSMTKKVVAAAATLPSESEEELSKQADLLAEIYSAEKALKDSQRRAEALRRRIHAQSNSQARLIVDHENQMKVKASQRAEKQTQQKKLEDEAQLLYKQMQGVLQTEQSTAAAAALRCQEALRERDEAREQLEGMKESVQNRKTSIAFETEKQSELKQKVAEVNAEICELERKKQEQIAHMDELKAKVVATKQLETSALEDLEQRKQVLVTLQKSIDALKKIRKGQ